MTAPRALDPYAVAHLAGGVPRVVETALAELVGSGRVRAVGGLLTTLQPGRTDPVEAAVLDAIGTRGHRSVETVRWRVAADDRLLGVGRGLVADGLLRPPPRWMRGQGGRPTRAGREVLRRLAREAAAGAPAVLLVALHGPAGVPDPVLRRALTERPPAPAAAPGPDVRAVREYRRAQVSGDLHALARRPGTGVEGGG